MSNEASNTAVSHSAAKRTLALLTLVALLVTFSSVRVADAEDPSLDDVASTLDQAGLLASTTSDPDADVAVDGSSASLPDAQTADDQLLVGDVAETEEVVDSTTDAAPSDEIVANAETETGNLETSDLSASATGTNAADELTVSEPLDDSTGAGIDADDTYTEEDAIADAAATDSDAGAETYTEEDAVAEANESPTPGLLPVHGYPVHVAPGDPETSDDGVVLEIEVGSSDEENGTPISSGYSNGDVDTNDLLLGADGRPVDGIPIHDGVHLSPAAVDESATSAAFGNLLVDTVTNTVSQAVTQALPHRNWVPVRRPVSEIVIPAPATDEENPEVQSGDEEDLLIFAAQQPGPPVAESDDTAVLDASAEVAATVVPSTVVPATTPETATPQTTTTAAPTVAAAAPTTVAPPTIARRPRPAPPTTAAPAPSPVVPATLATTTTAVPDTTTTTPPVTVAPTTTVTPTPTTAVVEQGAPAEDEAAAPPTTELVEKEEEVDFVVGQGGVAGNMVVEDDEEASADEQALAIPSPLGAFEFRGNAARLGAVWALWVLGTVAIMALWLPIPALRRNTNSSLPRRRS